MGKRKKRTKQRQEPIAIVGMSCLFPNAHGLKEYWRLLRTGEDAIREVPETHWSGDDYFHPEPGSADTVYCKRGGFLEPVDFDPMEFGIPPTILEATDTAQLLALVVAKQALDDAGYGANREFDRERASVILGVTSALELLIPLGARLGHPHWKRALREAGVDEQVAQQVMDRIADEYVPWQENSFPGLLGNVVAGRIANRLNLRGTNCVVDAACASSLSAVHLATLELAAGRSDMVVTGGVDAFNDIFMFMCFGKTQALSRSGDARPFSADADGTVIGEGVGMLVMKRLADAERDGDRVYAVLKGVGTSSDGRSQSIYAPRAEGQAIALRDAYEVSGVSPATVELVEAHGTGTKVGDVVEFDALRSVYSESSDSEPWCALGSVKAQIGHTKAAAGAASLIKSVLALHHRVLPPTIKTGEPNPKLEIEQSPFYVSDKPRPWIRDDEQPRRAGVSSFGFGGSNFHAVLEEYPQTDAEPAWDGTVEILAFSADAQPDLLAQLDEWIDAADDELSAEELSRRAAKARAAFRREHELRLAIVVERGRDLAALLRSARSALERHGVDDAWHEKDVYFGSRDVGGELALLFPGQGSQYTGMGRDLACVFPEALDAIEEAHRDAGTETDLAERIYPRPTRDEAKRQQQEDELTRTQVTQPALGAVSLAMLRVLKRFGIKADFAAGHSYGELVALRAAGRIGDAALRTLSGLRAKLMGEADGDDGAMLAVQAPLDEIDELLDCEKHDAIVANRNAPSQGILSGVRHAIDAVAHSCQARRWPTKLLRVSSAFHSKLMNEASRRFRQALDEIRFEIGRIPVFANLTARAYPDDPKAARDTLAKQMCSPVLFMDQIRHLYDAGARTFLEVGPKAVLTGLTRSILQGRQFYTAAIDAAGGRGHGLVDVARVLALTAALGHVVDLQAWEQPAPERPDPSMTVSLVGANYRAPRPKTSIPAPTKPTPSQIRTTGTEVMNQSGNGHPAAAPSPAPQACCTGATPTAPPPSAATNVAAPAGSQTLAYAFQVVQEGLRSMQALQQQTAAAHQRFLEAQDQAQKSFQVVMESHRRLMQSALGLPVSEDAYVAPPVAPSQVVTTPPPRVERFAAPAPVAPPAAYVPPAPVAPAYQPQPVAPYVPPPAPASSPAPAKAAVPAAAPLAESFDDVLLEVVSGLTGYPVEMIELDMDMEADLGIDSIKRLEILGEVQRRMPDLQQVDSQYLGSLRTLRDISQYMSAPAAGANGDTHAGTNGDGAKSGGNGHAAAAKSPLERQVLTEVELPKGATRPFEFAPDRSVLVTDDDPALAVAIVERLSSAGVNAETIDPCDAETGSGPSEVCGVIVVAPATGMDSVSDDDNGGAAFLKRAFRIARQHAAALQEAAAAGGALFATVSRVDGAFGLRGQACEPITGGLAGLAKTAAQEWSAVRCRALDVDAAWQDADAIAARIVEELQSAGPLEVGLSASQRVGLQTVARVAEPAERGPALLPGEVVVVTGGARGVTADCVVALAAACRPTMVLLGRSPSPTAEPDWLRGVRDEAAIKRALLANGGAGKAKIKPAELERCYRQTIANREIAETLARVRQAGANATYVSVDIRDADAVAETLSSVRDEYGPIRGVAHGAGVLEDRLLTEKTDEQFDRVFDTKVRGLAALLSATRDDELSVLAMFSSVSGRFGRRGQVDYAMANEVLNKVAQREATRRPGCRVTSINWGPWDGGMVTPALRREFEREGVGVIPLESGAAAFVQELADRTPGAVEVVIGSSLPTVATDFVTEEPTASAVPTAFVFERTLDVDGHPFLRSHVIGGKPVLPIAMMFEWFAAAALHDNPGLSIHGIDDLRVFKGVILNGKPAQLRFCAARAVGANGTVPVDTELHAAAGDSLRLHARARVLLADGSYPHEIGELPDGLATETYSRSAQQIYDDVLFHGPHFRAIESVDGISARGMVARFHAGASPAEWMAEPLRDAWLTDPLAIDVALQLGIVWAHDRLGGVALPSYVAGYRQLAKASRREPLTAALCVREHDAARLRADVLISSASGTAVAQLLGVEWTVDASLRAAFDRRTLAAV